MDPYDEYTYTEIFTANPVTQPLFRRVSKLGYKLSEFNFRNVQCQYPIGKNEFVKYLNTYPDDIIIFILNYKMPQFAYLDYIHLNKIPNENINLLIKNFPNEIYDNINFGEKSDNIYKIIKSRADYNPDYELETDVNNENYYVYSTRISDVKIINKYTNNILNHDEIINVFDVMLDTNYKIFFDPITTFNIFSQRVNCSSIIDNYAKNKTLSHINEIIELLSNDIRTLSLLNLYIGSIGIILGKVNFLTGYIWFMNAYEEDFNEELLYYDEKTRDERNQIKLYIYEQINIF